MRIHVLFHHYDADPNLMPNAVAVWDEYLMDENPQGWDDEVAKAEAGTFGPGPIRQAVLEVDDDQVLALFDTAEIDAALTPAGG